MDSELSPLSHRATKQSSVNSLFYLVYSTLFVPSPVYSIHTVWHFVRLNSVLAVVPPLSCHFCHSSNFSQVYLEPLICAFTFWTPSAHVFAIAQKVKSCQRRPVVIVITSWSCEWTIRNPFVFQTEWDGAPVNCKTTRNVGKLHESLVQVLLIISTEPSVRNHYHGHCNLSKNMGLQLTHI